MEKGYGFLLGRMYFTGSDGYQNLLVFPPMLNLLIMDSNDKITKWIESGISPKNIKPFDPSLAPIISTFGVGGISIKFHNSVLVQKILFHHIVISC